MFNNNSFINNSIKINSVSGTLVKNYRKSFFKRFHMKSPLAEMIFDAANPHIEVRNENRKIVVLQTMLCGEGELLAEIMWLDDFNELFESESKGGDEDELKRNQM